ncbi:MFS transporter [Xinfangfangia sp. CPCC 101601]|uniref:MFS transporter n=1 Tax=Pseudogemmobacter lacusdianii TaxID=3069608 RepID=A0ABU0W0I4_9RHOB|nr:MFS transporter [Xinfangfangia sp. CPCC 101601]MDQ2067487.1 MFS transporter [Xinfangfangia sp. CPCC 101601]
MPADTASSSPLSPLRHPSFRLIWTATLVANLGSLIQGVGAAWKMAELSPSASMVALVQASTTLPIMVLAVAAGAIADNFDRRRVMLVAQAFMFIISAALAVAAWMDLLGPWTLLCFTFLLGLGAALHLPSWQASMRDLVPREDLPAAITLNSMSFNLMRSVGPALGGLIVASMGAAVAFGLNAISYLAVIYALYHWQSPIEERSLPAEKLGRAIFSGLRYVSLSPNLSRVMLRAFVFGIAAVAVMALLPLVARDQVDGGAITFGTMLGLFGFGAIFGAFFSGLLRRKVSIETIVAGGFLSFALGSVALSMAHSVLTAVPGLMICGAAWVLTLSNFNVSTQLATPRWVVGRALAIYQTMAFGGMALGAWAWGFVADHVSIQAALIGSAVLLVLGAALGIIRPMPDLNDVNLDPANRFNTPALRLDLKANSGPIMVMIDWDIPAEHTNAFLRLMSELRAIRRRDGARQWALLRDLEKPDIWVESYHVATWTEYLRHNQRRTATDALNFDQMLALHRGPDRPQVHRMIERQTVPLTDDLPLLPKDDPQIP